jgi:outer membrane lipoprotein carrier protein
MMFKALIILASAFTLFVSMAFAQSASDLLDQRLSQFRNITSDFHQVIQSAQGEILQESFGQMFVQRPNQFRWHVIKPIHQLIIASYGKIWIYDPDLEQVIIRQMDDSIGKTPILLLASPLIHLKENFSVTRLSAYGDIEEFKLVPIKPDESFETILVSFKQGKIFKMTLMHALDQITTLYFSSVALNVDLKKELFEFQIPKGVDVIQ